MDQSGVLGIAGGRGVSTGLSGGRRRVASALVALAFLWSASAAPATPDLTAVPGTPLATGFSPISVAFSPDGKLLAVPSLEGRTVTLFTVPPGGPLSQVGAPTPVGHTPGLAVFSPDGRFLVTANEDKTLSVFSVSSLGSLTEVPGSPFTTGAFPAAVAFSPNGRLLATANDQANSASIFSVSSSGALTEVPGSPFATGAQPTSVAFSFGVKLVLATANSGDNTLSMFTVGSSGILTPVNAPIAHPGREPWALAFSPVGGFLAVVNALDSTVAMYTVAADGTPTKVATATATDLTPLGLAFGANGRLLAVAGEHHKVISVFGVDTKGRLTLVAGPMPQGAAPGAGPVASLPVAFTRDGGLLATADIAFSRTGANTSSISVWSVANALTSPTAVVCAPAAFVIGGSTTCAATITGNAMHPGGTVSFATDSSGTVSPSTCTLALIGGNQARCGVTYEPSSIGSGIHTITATYSGDANNPTSYNSASVLVQPLPGTSATAVSCAPGTVATAGSTTCTATVTGLRGAGTPTGGAVTFATNSSGSFGASRTCTPVSGAGTTASCQVTYTPTTVGSGSHKIYANYSGDRQHAPSSASTTITVTP